MGRGPAVTFMDKTTITKRTLLDFVISIAEQYSIPFQLKKTVSGGTDAGMIHLTEGGIPSVTVSLPVRYIHGPWGVASEDDFTHYLELAKAIIREAAGFHG
jgi:endoglucanase